VRALTRATHCTIAACLNAAAVNVPALEYIVDCVVFPSRGQRPQPTEMAGGDLDGDQYFAIFDTTLHPTGCMRNMVSHQ
jgi:RNA dependent RNA polymerase